MKLTLHTLGTSCSIFFGFLLQAQCPAGYNQVQLNWDNLSFLNSSTYAATYVSAGAIAAQNFAFGTNELSITHTYTGANVQGEDGAHTGAAGSYGTGSDIHFVKDGTITFTFQNAVQNLRFSIYDIDLNQNVVLTAANGSTPVTITAAPVAGSFLSITGSGTFSATASAGAATVDEASAVASVNVDVNGPVTSLTLTVANSGVCTKKCGTGGAEDGSFWISDITACSQGSFPVDDQKTGNNQPFTGQPDYFLTTPDNNSVYRVDPATGKAWHVFTETGATYINSFAYDPYNKALYYVIDGSSSPSDNKKIKKYDFNTETSSVFINDITTLGIPTFDQGVESASAGFYGGALYIGIEGGSGRESMVWRINFDAGGNPLPACQVMGLSSGGHDWGDFILKDGILYDFNTNTSGSGSQFKHLNLTTGSMITYATPAAGQAGMSWAGDLYSVRNVIEKYNLDGTKGAPKTITVVRGPAWVGNAGDASESFKPKMDFGDAPASYDPAINDPAVHETDTSLRLGTNTDREWLTRGQTALANADNYDDGLAYTPLFNPATGSYLADVSVYNNTGSGATVCGWLDYNGNGVFETSEGITRVIPSSTAQQTVSLFWTGLSSALVNNSYTYLRIRITAGANTMTPSNSTGYFNSGEVEDYRVLVNSTALSAEILSFTAAKTAAKKVRLTWKVFEEEGFANYRVQKTAGGSNWQTIAVKERAGNRSRVQEFSFTDNQPFEKNLYRLQLVYADGTIKQSGMREVVFDKLPGVSIAPNPVKQKAVVSVYADGTVSCSLLLFNAQGVLVYKKQAALTAGQNTIPVDVSSLKAGAYAMQVVKEEKISTQKIVIE